jgi:hypothetical protein
MKLRQFNLVLLLIVLVCGILVGQGLTQRNMSAEQLSSREHELAAIQAARGAMDMIKSDLERAGYAETIPPSTAVAVRVKHPASDELIVAPSTGQSLSFRSSDGRESVAYEMEGHRLVRIIAGERRVLLQDARDFKVRPVNDGQSLNIAFWIPVGGRAGDPQVTQAAMYGHFVHAQ